MTNFVVDAPDSWKNDVRWKLAQVYKDKPEHLFEILFFLDEKDKANKDTDLYAPEWHFLKATVEKDEAFREAAKQLLDEIRNTGRNEELRSTAGSSSTLTPSVAHFVRGCVNFAIKYGKNGVETSLDDVVRVVDNSTGDLVMGGIAAIRLCCEAYAEIQRWWKGEISGKRCVKNLSDTALTIGGGVAGGWGAAALLSFFTVSFPGICLGSVFAGWAASVSMESISDILTRWVFGLPKEEALENAYRHLGVPVTATDAEVNRAFRKLCLKKHPDKGGSIEEFLALQVQMEIIRDKRESERNSEGKQCSNGNQIVKKELKW